jgi:FkbM family methyltransferase
MTAVLKKIEKLSSSFQEADFLPTIFGRYNKDVLSCNTPVVLYGAGSAGKELYACMRLHGVQPVCFCDSDSSRIHNMYCGIPVISNDELKKVHKNSLIVITTKNYSQEIIKYLVDNGFCNDRLFRIDPIKMTFYTQFYQQHATLENINENGQKISDTYNLLTDQKSKDLFIEKISLSATGADYKSYRAFIKKFFGPIARSGFYHPPKFYFNNKIVPLNEKEVLLDGGSFIGETVNEFIKFNKKNKLSYKCIYCFEPDPHNYEKLIKNTANCENTTCFKFGLWSHTTNLQFLSSENIQPTGARIIKDTGDIDLLAPKAGNITVNAISIDELFIDKEITFIKMDIEGAEIEAIKGAANTIKKNKPKLAISVYHKSSDIFEIPLIVHKICPEYKLYLRHLSNNFTETVLFATV